MYICTMWYAFFFLMHEYNVLVYECRLLCSSSSDVYMYYVVGLFACMSSMCLSLNVG